MANLFLTEADLEEDAKGVAQPAETYSLNGSLVGSAWKLIFRDGSKSGILSLPLPMKMLSYAVDIRDGRTSAGGGPLLYKEWRFEGPVTGTGIFQAGTTSATKYFLVFQGVAAPGDALILRVADGVPGKSGVRILWGAAPPNN
jgi:hypothetical protein